LAAAVALAEKPERVEKLFNTKAYPDNGMFNFNFFLRGKPVQVSIDDRLPYDNGENALVNARKSENDAYWVPLLEKAAAKYFINYENLDGGLMSESYKMLTGMPVMTFDSEAYDADIIFKFIESVKHRDWLVTASNVKKVDGLPGLHAYTVLGTHTLRDCDGGEIEKLIKLRNPWAEETYTGPYNDKDDQWTEELLKQVDHLSKNDGSFFMPVASFKENFESFFIAMYEDWNTSSLDATWDRTSTKQTFNVTNPVEQGVVFGLEMYNNRLFPNGCDESEMMDMFAFSVFDLQTK
jgi:hypothetical protein